MRRVLLSVALSVAALVAAPYAGAQEAEEPSPPSLTAEQRAELESGEKLIAAQRGDLNRGEVIGLVDAPIDEVWEILGDIENHKHWFPDTLESSVASRGSDHVILQGLMDVPWPIANRNYQMRITEETRQVDGKTARIARFRYVEGSGNLDAANGYWWVQPYGDDGSKTLVKYVLNVDLGIWLPSGIIRWAQRRMFPDIVNGIQEWHDSHY